MATAWEHAERVATIGGELAAAVAVIATVWRRWHLRLHRRRIREEALEELLLAVAEAMLFKLGVAENPDPDPDAIVARHAIVEANLREALEAVKTLRGSKAEPNHRKARTTP